VTTETIASTSPAAPKPKPNWLRRIGDVIWHGVIQARIWKRIYPGVMHFSIFWGVTIQILGTAVNLMQIPGFLPFELPFPRGTAYLWFELVMDIGGGLILLGVSMALLRRLVFRPKYLVSKPEDWLALTLLLIIPLLGFSSEAFRLHSVEPAWRVWSPIGNLFAQGYAAMGLTDVTSIGVHQFFTWSHAIAGLAFVIVIPFTKLRHIFSGPLNIFFRPDRHDAALETIEDIEEAETLGVGEVAEFESQAMLSFNACVQCGRCEDLCPATISGMHYSPRELLLSLREAMNDWADGSNPETLIGSRFDKEFPWLCTTCGACIAACPLHINPVTSVVELRRYLTLTMGDVPGSVAEALTGMERYGNPWGLPKEQRAQWANQLGARVLQPGESCDVLVFLGCAISYDDRNTPAGKQLITLLKQAGVDYAILGPEEGCCGETPRRLGHEYLFQVMAEENIAKFNAMSFKRIVTPCAHCFNTLKNEYPQFGGDFEVFHHTEFLQELLRDGRLKAPSMEVAKGVTYHDSCYLGRYNQIYDAPREILSAISGVEQHEMPRRMENTFCCGGGGGQMWLETDPNTRLNLRRLDEAVANDDVEMIVTACPYCTIMFDDAIRDKGLSESVVVRDIAEVLSGNGRKSSS
jgi:Fe-S oxidoreductase/nitrate reductase gamma subunit